MPEHRLEKTRRAYGPDEATWRRPSDNAAAQLDRRASRRTTSAILSGPHFRPDPNLLRLCWNTIEADES